MWLSRLAYPMLDQSRFEELAALIKVQPVVVRQRCEHGYTQDEYCANCAGGYVDDMHPYACLYGDAILHTVTDDGESVLYIPKRFENRLRKLDWSRIFDSGITLDDCPVYPKW